MKAWTAKPKPKAEGAADSYVYALDAGLAQIMADAVHDGVIPRSPCSRRTPPGTGQQRPYVATETQLWALVDTVPENLRSAVAGRVRRPACRLGLWAPGHGRRLHARRDQPGSAAPGGAAQDGDQSDFGADPAVAGEQQPAAKPADVEAARARALPEGFRFHDLRHFYASLLTASGADVKVVQARLRHASAKTTLDTYAHLWPDTEESARAAVGAAMATRADPLRTSGRRIER